MYRTNRKAELNLFNQSLSEALEIISMGTEAVEMKSSEKVVLLILRTRENLDNSLRIKRELAMITYDELLSRNYLYL